MNLRRTRLTIALFCALGLTALAFAGTPRTIGYQGYLKNSDGTPVHNTPVNITFRLYSSTSGVNALWTGTPKSVAPQNGLYSTQVGPVDLPFDRSYWLGVTVNNDELRPLQQLDSVPYALRAAIAEGVTVRPGEFLYTATGAVVNSAMTPRCSCDLESGGAECPSRNYASADLGTYCFDVFDTGSYDPDTGEYFPFFQSAQFMRNGSAPPLLRTGTYGGIGINTAPSTYDLDINGTVRATTFTGDGSGLTNVPVTATSITGTLGTAHGGTGFTGKPTAAGQYLRSTGVDTWGAGAIQAADIPNLSGSYVDLTRTQTIGGAKTFSSEIQATGGVKINGIGNGITFADGTSQDTARTDCIGRYEDNGDGTVTDCRSGLVWLKNANCFGLQNWANATSYSTLLGDGLCGLTDNSSPGDWRLPTKTEFMAMIASAKKQGFSNPVLTNGAGTAKWTAGDVFLNVQADKFYWSSTVLPNTTDHAIAVSLNNGLMLNGMKTDATSVHFWPVRAGQ